MRDEVKSSLKKVRGAGVGRALVGLRCGSASDDGRRGVAAAWIGVVAGCSAFQCPSWIDCPPTSGNGPRMSGEELTRFRGTELRFAGEIAQACATACWTALRFCRSCPSLSMTVGSCEGPELSRTCVWGRKSEAAREAYLEEPWQKTGLHCSWTSMTKRLQVLQSVSHSVILSQPYSYTYRRVSPLKALRQCFHSEQEATTATSIPPASSESEIKAPLLPAPSSTSST